MRLYRFDTKKSALLPQGKGPLPTKELEGVRKLTNEQMHLLNVYKFKEAVIAGLASLPRGQLEIVLTLLMSSPTIPEVFKPWLRSLASLVGVLGSTSPTLQAVARIGAIGNPSLFDFGNPVVKNDIELIVALRKDSDLEASAHFIGYVAELLETCR